MGTEMNPVDCAPCKRCGGGRTWLSAKMPSWLDPADVPPAAHSVLHCCGSERKLTVHFSAETRAAAVERWNRGYAVIVPAVEPIACTGPEHESVDLHETAGLEVCS